MANVTINQLPLLAQGSITANTDTLALQHGSTTQSVTPEAATLAALGQTGQGVGIGTTSPTAKLDVRGGNVLIDAFGQGAGAGLFFRAGFLNTDQPSITVKDHSGNAPDGLYIAAADGISFGTASAERMRLDASGNFLVGTTSTSGNAGGVVLRNLNGLGAIVLSNNSGATDYSVRFYYGTTPTLVGNITTSATATAYNTSSDYRLKDNQQPLTGSGEFIDALAPKTWEWKADGSKGVGFIAHEVQEVSPTSVVGEKDATRVEQYEISPAVPATYDEEGNELTPAVEAVMGEREVPAYQAMEYGSAEFIANIISELQSLRKRVAALEGTR